MPTRSVHIGQAKLLRRARAFNVPRRLLAHARGGHDRAHEEDWEQEDSEALKMQQSRGFLVFYDGNCEV